jgi:hypothetical protein
MQQSLKFPPGAAWARIVSAEFFHELFFTVDYLVSPLHVRFRRKSLSPFAAPFKSIRPQIVVHFA